MLESTSGARGSAQKLLGMRKQVAELPKNHGRAIFVYSNIYTNQVVYSLDRTMNNANALKQLAFAGKNTVPRALRKDLWRPLCTVLFPEGDQGRHAYRKLREWRRLHEVDWDRSELPQLEKEQLRKARGHPLKGLAIAASASRVGGPRVQHTDVDLRKRKMIMDQKAASIADLAAVLAEQEQLGRDNADRMEQTRKSLAAILVPLADSAGDAEVEALSKQISDLHTQRHQSNELDQPAKKQLDRTINKLARDLQSLRQVREILSEARRSSPAPDTDNASMLTSALSTLEANTVWRMHQERAMGQSYAESVAQENRELARRQAIREARRLSRQPSSAAPGAPGATVPGSKSTGVGRPAAAGGTGRGGGPDADVDTGKKTLASAARKLTVFTSGILAAIRRGPPKAYTTRGVEIKWTNPLDAEFAARWPRDVRHLPMGYARHTAPPALSKSPRLSVNDGLFDLATGRFVGAASRLDNPQVQRFNREKSRRAAENAV